MLAVAVGLHQQRWAMLEVAVGLHRQHWAMLEVAVGLHQQCSVGPAVKGGAHW